MKSLNKTKRIALFGLGEAGSLIAADLQIAGFNITAYDPKSVITPLGITRAKTDTQAEKDSEVVKAITEG